MEKENRPDEELRILFTGDLCPVYRIEESVLKGNHNNIFTRIRHELDNNDLNVIDLECPLTLSGKRRPKTGPHQKAHPDCIKVVTDSGAGLAALANNHILDYGETGVKDTLDLCIKNNIGTVGIGSSPTEARKPFTKEIRGKRIAFYSMADNEFITAPDGTSQCNPIDPVDNFHDIQLAKGENDFVVAIVHAGNEFYDLPSPRTKALYRFFIDAGADAVISHHTHAFSGYEIYKSKPIFYGLGNFLYDWPGKINTNWNRGYMVRLRLTQSVDFDIIPINQCNGQPEITLLNEAEEKAFSNEMERLCMIIADDHMLSEAFSSYCESVFPMYDSFIEPYFGKYLTALRNRGLFPRVLSKKKRLYLLNLSRCESHREVMLRMLKRVEKL